MKRNINGIIKKLRDKKFNTQIIITICTTVTIMSWYAPKWFDGIIRKTSGILNNPNLKSLFGNTLRSPIIALVLFLLIPILSLILLGEPIKKFGMRLGDLKKGLIYTGIFIGIMLPFLFFISKRAGFINYYQNKLSMGFLALVIIYAIYMFCWEFLFRGYLLFALEDQCGVLTIWIQAIPFAVIHASKPLPEALSCYFGGVILGYISQQTRSFLYSFLVHWGIYCLLLGFIAIR